MMFNTLLKNSAELRAHHKVPVSMKGKVDLFKIGLRDIPILKPLGKDGGALAMRFTKLARRRNELVHGSAIHLGKGFFQGILPSVASGEYAIHDHCFNISDAAVLNHEIAEFCLDVLNFMDRIEAAFAK